MTQQTLWNDEGQIATNTRAAAAAAIAPIAGSMIRQVMNYVAARGEHGATDEEIAAALRMNQSTERPRRLDLLKRGHICKSGKSRKTQSGWDAIVWRATGKPFDGSSR